MSTSLLIEKLTKSQIENNIKLSDNKYIELSEGFLYDFFINDEVLDKSLLKGEKSYILPNWGRVENFNIDRLSPDLRKKYLELLKETIRINSFKKMDSFLEKNKLMSYKLIDRAKRRDQFLKIIYKLKKCLVEDCKEEFGYLLEFIESSKDNDYFLIEYED